MQQFEITPSSEECVLITWPEKICPVQHQTVIATEQAIKAQLPNVIFESIVSYNAMMLYYRFDKMTYFQLKQHIIDCVQLSEINEQNPLSLTSIVEIPVYYGEEAAWDLADIAKQCQLSITEVITLHSQRTYRAYALGFTPGFCYLGPLDKKLNLPRKSTPRLSVPKGAVAIAEQQTAVYPNMSPGGWHIIGQTPLEMYQLQKELFLPLISVGQQVKFTPIDHATFIEYQETSRTNSKNIKPSVQGSPP
jgi:inhibitor of KinA